MSGMHKNANIITVLWPCLHFDLYPPPTPHHSVLQAYMPRHCFSQSEGPVVPLSFNVLPLFNDTPGRHPRGKQSPRLMDLTGWQNSQVLGTVSAKWCLLSILHVSGAFKNIIFICQFGLLPLSSFLNRCRLYAVVFEGLVLIKMSVLISKQMPFMT